MTETVCIVGFFVLVGLHLAPWAMSQLRMAFEVAAQYISCVREDWRGDGLDVVEKSLLNHKLGRDIQKGGDLR